VAQPTLAASASELGRLRPAVGALSAPSAGGGPFRLPSHSEAVMRGAGCGNSASPDLWGPRAGNRPGLPDPLPRRSQAKPGPVAWELELSDVNKPCLRLAARRAGWKVAGGASPRWVEAYGSSPDGAEEIESLVGNTGLCPSPFHLCRGLVSMACVCLGLVFFRVLGCALLSSGEIVGGVLHRPGEAMRRWIHLFAVTGPRGSWPAAWNPG